MDDVRDHPFRRSRCFAPRHRPSTSHRETLSTPLLSHAFQAGAASQIQSAACRESPRRARPPGTPGPSSSNPVRGCSRHCPTTLRYRLVDNGRLAAAGSVDAPRRKKPHPKGRLDPRGTGPSHKSTCRSRTGREREVASPATQTQGPCPQHNRGDDFDSRRTAGHPGMTSQLQVCSSTLETLR